MDFRGDPVLSPAGGPGPRAEQHLRGQLPGGAASTSHKVHVHRHGLISLDPIPMALRLTAWRSSSCPGYTRARRRSPSASDILVPRADLSKHGLHAEAGGVHRRSHCTTLMHVLHTRSRRPEPGARASPASCRKVARSAAPRAAPRGRTPTTPDTIGELLGPDALRVRRAGARGPFAAGRRPRAWPGLRGRGATSSAVEVDAACPRARRTSSLTGQLGDVMQRVGHGRPGLPRGSRAERRPAWASAARPLREARRAHPRARGRHPQGRALGWHHHGHGHGQLADGHPGAQGRGHDRRRPARPCPAHRWPQVQRPGRPPLGRQIVIIPKRNEKDLRDIPDEVRSQMKL